MCPEEVRKIEGVIGMQLSTPCREFRERNQGKERREAKPEEKSSPKYHPKNLVL